MLICALLSPGKSGTMTATYTEQHWRVIINHSISKEIGSDWRPCGEESSD